jgi:ferredoxin--NADP+ reductase
VAHFLRKRWPTAEIVIFDRLDLPYGLVRYGVAPDHAGTKAVASQFDRLFERDGVRYVGGTEIGRDLTVDHLRRAFDVIVLATGLSADRALGIPGATGNSPVIGATPEGALAGAALAGVYGSGRLTRLINGHPDESADGVVFGSRVAIVGQGNVAIDLLRLLLMSPQDLRGHGVADEVVKVIAAGPVRHIDIVGRSSLSRAKFGPAMIRELAKIPNVRFLADRRELHDADTEPRDPVKRDVLFGLLAAATPSDDIDGTFAIPAHDRTVRFHFGWVPERIEGNGSVESLIFRSADPHVADGAEPSLRLDVDSVLTAIGFLEAPDAPLRRETHESPDSNLEIGQLAAGLYCVGWLRRGPQGMVADAIGAAADSGEFPPGKLGFAGLKLTTYDPVLLAQPSPAQPETKERS